MDLRNGRAAMDPNSGWTELPMYQPLLLPLLLSKAQCPSTTPIQSPTLLPLDQPSVKDKGYLTLEDLGETPTQIQTEVSKGAPSSNVQ
ncbi:hypothetical protein BGX26_000683 [Mortierella sp. AD094]|nr:hypothetical protein BGX26_000683 [Mortierella sp. AD094]